MTKFVVHDIGRKACVNRIILRTKIIELQRFTCPVIERIFPVSRMWHYDQPISLKRPRNPAPQAVAILKESQCSLQQGPHIYLVELELLRLTFVQFLAVENECLSGLVPLRSRHQKACV